MTNSPSEREGHPDTLPACAESSWNEVHAFSQPLTVSAGEVIVSTPMRTVKALLQTFEDGGNWMMTEQASHKRPRPPKAPKPPPAQRDLF